jgi:hypothetical protein
MHHKVITTHEAGNAVTLTLLGLAVAILAGVAVLYVVGKNAPSTTSSFNEDATQTQEPTPTTPTTDPRVGWHEYTNEEFGFSAQYPTGWIVATGTVQGVPVVTLYDARRFMDATTTSDFDVHNADFRVSMYPEGIPASGGGEQTLPSTTVVPVPQAQTTDYVLTSGRAWATKATFERYPESWKSYGFMYGRVPVEQEQTTYWEGETAISPEEFDVYSGHTAKVSGYVDAVAWETLSLVLSSFTFKDMPQLGEASELDPITVTAPVPGAIISSPLIIEGEARGWWYFEASFPVRLVTDSGEVLAEVPAQALEDWMTEDYVPFTVSIVFAMPSATSGKLILSRDNPSGLPEHDAHIEIPVLFATP